MNIPSFIPTDDQGRPVAKPWIEWEPLFISAMSDAIDRDFDDFQDMIGLQMPKTRQWLQSPFSPEKDLVGEDAVFAEWRYRPTWKKKFIFRGFQYHAVLQPHTIFSMSHGVKTDFPKPQTRAQFIELFKIATGECLPLTKKAVKELTQ